MTKPSDPKQTPGASGPSHPWRAPPVTTDVGYATDADIDGATPSFMSALRRFRTRHGLSPLGQTPLLADEDLENLRAENCDRPGLDLEDIAVAADADPA